MQGGGAPGGGGGWARRMIAWGGGGVWGVVGPFEVQREALQGGFGLRGPVVL